MNNYVGYFIAILLLLLQVVAGSSAHFYALRLKGKDKKTAAREAWRWVPVRLTAYGLLMAGIIYVFRH